MPGEHESASCIRCVSQGKEISPFTAFTRVCIYLTLWQLGRKDCVIRGGPMLLELEAVRSNFLIRNGVMILHRLHLSKGSPCHPE